MISSVATWRWLLLVPAGLLLTPHALPAYTVLTHEAVIDSAWDANIKPLLLARFPGSDAKALIEAHSYAYGGCIIQDMGYYPFGDRFFTDLAHYVRSGDFVVNLIRDSQTLDEYAFALGSMAHYAADIHGHDLAVNLSVPIEYPKLLRKYGTVVTYEENPLAHLRVEFGFDVLQVAHGRYAPQSYHDFIGFSVAQGVLERAFHDTYSLDLRDLFADMDLTLGTYRHTVSGIIPEMTRVAWDLAKKDLRSNDPTVSRRAFIYNLSRAGYRKEWPSRYRQPGVGARILALVIRILPKIGPLKVLSVKVPTAATENLFQASFDRTLDEYRRLLRDQGQGRLTLPNLDLDTGAPTRPGAYWMADDAYAQLAIRLARRNPASIAPPVLQNVLAFFSDTTLPFATKTRAPKVWRQTLAALDKLRTPVAPSGPSRPARR